MTLPLCAWCGESMTGAALRERRDSAITIDHRHEAHRPRYGWHGECAKADPISPLALGAKLSPTAEITAKIEARGPGRVVRRVRR